MYGRTEWRDNKKARAGFRAGETRCGPMENGKATHLRPSPMSAILAKPVPRESLLDRFPIYVPLPHPQAPGAKPVGQTLRMKANESTCERLESSHKPLSHNTHERSRKVWKGKIYFYFLLSAMQLVFSPGKCTSQTPPACPNSRTPPPPSPRPTRRGIKGEESLLFKSSGPCQRPNRIPTSNAEHPLHRPLLPQFSLIFSSRKPS